MLEPKQGHYLWAMDAAGNFYVAPYEKYKDGTRASAIRCWSAASRCRSPASFTTTAAPSSGKDRWVMDSDSGRYVKPYAEVHPGQLKAARRLARQIAITSRSPGKRARAVRLHREFVAPGSSKPEMRKIFARSHKVGGYLLIPPKGAGADHLPRTLRRADKRAAWQRAAQKRLGRPRPSGRRTR